MIYFIQTKIQYHFDMDLTNRLVVLLPLRYELLMSRQCIECH